jgi:5-methylcytosine-specific restriction endonuclease McrA
MAQRYVAQGVCVECAKGANQRLREEDPEGCARRLKAWRSVNKEKVNAWARVWADTNPELAKAYQKSWRVANKEKLSARSMAWRAANRERFDEAARAWQKANKEHVAAVRAAWARANADRRRVSSKLWREQNADEIKAVKKVWLAANRLRLRCYTENRRLRKLANGGSHTFEQIEEMHGKQRHRCASCGSSIRKHYEIDHIVAVTRGGSNDISNIQLLCMPCNRSKSNKSPEQWAREQGRLL